MVKNACPKEVFMVRVVFEENLEALAREIAKSVDGEVVKLENAMNAPDVLEDISHVGLLYYKSGKDISDNMVKFIREDLGSIELKNLEYLFSVCVCKEEKIQDAGFQSAFQQDKAQHAKVQYSKSQWAKAQYAKPKYALKVVNRLCSRSGCLPSYSIAILEPFENSVVSAVCNDIKKEEIKLPYGSPFVGWYMKLAKKRFGV